MNKKFTEEQYQKIIDIDFGSIDEQKSKEVLIQLLDTFDIKQETLNLARALTNPLTREWAHDKFVEKEKKYCWTSKISNSSGRHKRLFRQLSSASIRDYFVIDGSGCDKQELLTESEIKEWGYNPDMFDREEV